MPQNDIRDNDIISVPMGLLLKNEKVFVLITAAQVAVLVLIQQMGK